MRAPKQRVVLTVLSGLAACDLITAPLPQDAERFTPPAVYARWWAMTEVCSGRSGELEDVSWYRVPGSEFMLGDQLVGGYWSENANRIVLAEESTDYAPMVRHEMLHALLRGGGHSRSEFLGECSSVVSCNGICLKEAGKWRAPQQDYVVLPAESLDVTSRAELLPRESDGQHWFELEIIVRNTRGRSVLVAVPADPMTPAIFGYDLRGPSGITGGEVATDSSTLFFQPFETKRRLFEFQVKAEPYDYRSSGHSDYHLSPGTYLARGGYGRRWSPFTTIAVNL